MPRYAGIFGLTVLIAGVAAWVTGGSPEAVHAMRPPSLVEIVGWLLLVGATLATLRYHHDRLLALVLISIVGLIVSSRLWSSRRPTLR